MWAVKALAKRRFNHVDSIGIVLCVSMAQYHQWAQCLITAATFIVVSFILERVASDKVCLTQR